MTDQEVPRRRGEIFFLWLSVLSVIMGFALTSTASSDHPNDIWFITGVISGFLGSILAFGFVLYISICSEYHYQSTVSNKEATTSENQDKAEDHKCPENSTTSRESPVHGNEGNLATEHQQNTNIQTVPQQQTEPRKWKSVTPESLQRLGRSPDTSLDDEKMDFTVGPQQCQAAGRTDAELEMLQQAEYVEVQEILNKATKMLQEFSLLAENLKAHRKYSCDTSFDQKSN